MTFTAPDIDYAGISPVIALTVGIVAVLLAGLVGAGRRQRIVVSLFGLATLAAAAGLCIWQWGEEKDLIAGALRLDDLGLAVSLIAIGSAAFCIPLSWREEAFDRAAGPSGHGEFQALLICSVLGMVLIAQAQNLIVFFVALELLSIPLYVLCGSALRRRESLESGLKYLIVGSLGSATLLYGLAMIYGATGATDFGAIASAIDETIGIDDPLLLIGIALAVAGLAFKASVAPFHQWSPDVYQGAPTPVTAFMATATKAAAFAVILRLFDHALALEQIHWGPA
ncbi:MAG TPA: proton-conducting transporter membrane subunit, partial [Solirubrobacterales bacterium]|nr:proton-conducting transporter membrane subunit [Solirubrobacterales bacterium]